MNNWQLQTVQSIENSWQLRTPDLWKLSWTWTAKPLGSTYRAEEKSDRHFNEAKTVICVICLDSLQKLVKLPCSHEFCSNCVDALRSRGFHQLCPLCRKPLPPGPEKLCEEADLLYIQVERQISRGKFSWSTLSTTCCSLKEAVWVPKTASLITSRS